MSRLWTWPLAGLLYLALVAYAVACKLFPKLHPEYPYGERWDRDA